MRSRDYSAIITMPLVGLAGKTPELPSSRMISFTLPCKREGLGVQFPRATRLVVLVDGYPRHDWLRGAVEKRLREEFAKLQVDVNKDKTRIVDLSKGESFGFLGFDFRRIRSRAGRWMPLRTPQLRKRTRLLRSLKEIFQRSRSQPVATVVAKINPILRGWVNYFASGHSSACFSFIRNWVEQKIRRHLARARQRRGFGGSGGVGDGCTRNLNFSMRTRSSTISRSRKRPQHDGLHNP